MDTPYTVAAAVLAHVQTALAEAERWIDLEHEGVAQVVVGGFVVDGCSALLVQPERVFRTSGAFPQEAIADDRCVGNPIAVTVAVGVWRCVPVLGENGEVPSIEDQEAAHSGILLDAALVWNVLAGAAILGVDPDDPGVALWERAGLSQDFPPVQGGLGGSETRATFGVPWYRWCL